MSGLGVLPLWLRQRAGGVLLHVSSLPGHWGIGNLGKPAFEFIDFLKECGFKFWQICPVGPTGFGDSPYQVFSSFAGNPYFIDWQPIVDTGLILDSELQELTKVSSCNKINFGDLHATFWPAAERAFRKFQTDSSIFDERYGKFDDFIETNASWLPQYSLFQSAKAKNNGNPWWLWPGDERTHSGFTENRTASSSAPTLHTFLQFVFHGQWKFLKKKAKSQKVQILGDLPLYVAPDCADVWQRPDLFQLDSDSGTLSNVAGVPPDYFNPRGQLWGNPLYDWPRHEEENYSWWLDRLKAQTELFDVTRIDHFRGFHDYWSIPGKSGDACEGNWENGPGLPFFDFVEQSFPDMPFLAEDLGMLTEGVRKLRQDAGLPGMAVLQFAFDGNPDNSYLPHNLTPDLVAYTGTHDNDTSMSWYKCASEEVQRNFRTYLGCDGSSPSWDMIKTAFQSVSQLCIAPMQDLLSLGSETRLNKPGEPQGNWGWRMTREQLDEAHSNSSPYLLELGRATGRINHLKI